MRFNVRFQFHKGSINTYSEVIDSSTDSRFNSIKVRLIHDASRFNTLNDAFQFHKGSINTFGCHVYNGGGVVFQFHKGSINTKTMKKFLSIVSSFNSIKVRLILCVKNSKLNINLFQFHKGSINTLLPSMLTTLWLSFNSIKVRLIPY